MRWWGRARHRGAGALPALVLAWLLPLVLAPLGCAPPAGATAPEEVLPPPGRLALVVDCSAAAASPWQGTNRRLAIEAALAVELKSLPLRTQAGLWLAGGGGFQVAIPPTGALELKMSGLVLPDLGGGSDLTPALAAAAAWLKEAGPGAILVLSGPGSQLDPAALAGLSQDSFVHALVLGLLPADGPLERLAREYGGGFFQAAEVGQVAPLLHRAVLLGLSRASLMVLAHGDDNQPRPVTYRLERRDQLALRRQGIGNRPVQVLPGVYTLVWPRDHGLGPGPIPEKVAVAPHGLTRLWAGGRGVLKLDSRGPQGQALNWVASVSNLETGQVVAAEKRTPLELPLPAGFYRIKTQRPPLAWTVELAAGQTREVVTGPPGRLTLTLTGPSGPWRVPYRVDDLQGLREVGTGYTNAPLSLAPGRYRVEVQTAPPQVMELELHPGQEIARALEPVGGLLVRRDHAGKSHGYLVLDQAGRPLMRGVGDRPLPLQPGRYQVRFAAPAPAVEVDISPGGLTALDPPQ